MMCEETCIHLLCFGNPLLDMSLHLQDADLLKKYDLKADNVMEAEEKHKPLFEEVFSRREVAFSPGGGAQNTARLYRWVLGEVARVAFIGGLGRDKFGLSLEKLVQADGVITRYIYHETEPTGRSVNLIYGANRSLVADIGAANWCRADSVFQPAVEPLLAAASCVYVEGFLLSHDVDTAVRVAQYCRRAGSRLVLSLSGVYVCERFTAAFCRMLPYVSYLFCHITEYRALAGALGLQADLPVSIEGRRRLLSSALQPAGCCPDNSCTSSDAATVCDVTAAVNGVSTEDACSDLCVVVTQSADPVTMVTGDQCLSVPVPSVSQSDIVDTTAAGDAFVAGFLAALHLQLPLEQCARNGILASREIMQQLGCTIPASSHPLSAGS